MITLETKGKHRQLSQICTKFDFLFPVWPYIKWFKSKQWFIETSRTIWANQNRDILKRKKMLVNYIKLACEIITRSNTKLVTIFCVIPNTLLYCFTVSTITFKGINGSNCCSEPLTYDWPNRPHPIPQASLKCNNWIICYGFRRVQSIKPNAVSCWSVIEIPW